MILLAELGLAVRAEPIVEGKGEEVAGVDDVGRLARDDRAAEVPFLVGAELDAELVLDDVEDLVDDEPHGAVAIGEDQDRLASFCLHDIARVDRDQRHELAAVLHDRLAVRFLDLVELDLLEPRHQGQRHRLRAVVAGAEEQQAGALAAFVGAGCRRLLLDPFLDPQLAARGGDAVGIEDHDHAAVAEDGIAREHRDVAQDRRDRLDDDFFGVEDAVDDDAEAVGADLRHDDEGLVGFRRRLPEMQQLLQRDQREETVAQAQHRGVVEALDLVLGILRGAHQLDDADLRDRETLGGAFDDERRDDGEGQRDLDDEGRPLPAALRISIVPPIFSILVRTTSMPTPRPETLVTWLAVEKPALKMNCWIC